MSSNEHLASLLRMTVRNSQSIDVLFGVANDFACLIESGLERCARMGCAEPATVQLIDFGIRMCDACAATMVIMASNRIVTDPDEKFNFFRATCANEELWVDIEDAPRIRKLREYVCILKKDDEPNPPEHFDQLH